MNLNGKIMLFLFKFTCVCVWSMCIARGYGVSSVHFSMSITIRRASALECWYSTAVLHTKTTHSHTHLLQIIVHYIRINIIILLANMVIASYLRTRCVVRVINKFSNRTFCTTENNCMCEWVSVCVCGAQNNLSFQHFSFISFSQFSLCSMMRFVVVADGVCVWWKWMASTQHHLEVYISISIFIYVAIFHWK